MLAGLMHRPDDRDILISALYGSRRWSLCIMVNGSQAVFVERAGQLSAVDGVHLEDRNSRSPRTSWTCRELGPPGAPSPTSSLSKVQTAPAKQPYSLSKRQLCLALRSPHESANRDFEVVGQSGSQVRETHAIHDALRGFDDTDLHGPDSAVKMQAGLPEGRERSTVPEMEIV